MILNILVLFGFTLVGGYSVQFFSFNKNLLQYHLVFAASFLFSITIIHIMPELYASAEDPFLIGLFVLLGFFFQQLLERFTSGVEHGHYHENHQISTSSKYGLVIALTVHSLFEGALLMHDSPFHDHHESHSLLIGIILHKIPAAFALMATLNVGKKFTTQQWIILLIFSLASPLGVILSNAVLSINATHMTLLFAFVSGNFLHISTTIFVESSPGHKFNTPKALVSIGAAALAIIAEFVV